MLEELLARGSLGNLTAERELGCLRLQLAGPATGANHSLSFSVLIS